MTREKLNTLESRQVSGAARWWRVCVAHDAYLLCLLNLLERSFAQHSKTETINDLELFFHQLKLREFSPPPKTLRVNAVEKKKFSRK